MTSKFLLFGLLGVVFASACAGVPGLAPSGGPSYSGTAGVKINFVKFDAQSVFEGETVTLSTEIENVGSKTVNASTLYWLYGQRVDSSCPSDKPTAWCRSSGNLNGSLTNFTFAPPVVKGQRGDTFSTDITMKAPNQPEGQSFDYTFFIRVCYPYSTTASFSLTRYSREEFRSGGIQKQTEQQKRLSAGPIQIDMPSNQPLPISAAGTLRLFFTISDVGGGFALAQSTCANQPDPPAIDRNKISVKVFVDGQEVTGSAGDCTSRGASIKLTDKKGQLSCTANVGAVEVAKTFQIVAEATYVYYIDGQAKITIKDEALF